MIWWWMIKVMLYYTSTFNEEWINFVFRTEYKGFLTLWFCGVCRTCLVCKHEYTDSVTEPVINYKVEFSWPQVYMYCMMNYFLPIHIWQVFCSVINFPSLIFDFIREIRYKQTEGWHLALMGLIDVKNSKFRFMDVIQVNLSLTKHILMCR